MSHSGHVRRYICNTCKTGLRGPRNATTAPRRFIGTSEAASERGPSTHRPLRHLRPHKAVDSDQWIAQLPSKSLGIPSEVLILRDPERRQRGTRQVSLERGPGDDTQRSMTTDDILASIQAERKAPGQEEVNQHLNTLRPTAQHDRETRKIVLSQAAYENLHTTLFDGFTLVQLSRFFTISQGSQIVQERTEAERPTAGSPFVQSRWTALDVLAKPQDASNTREGKSRKHLIIDKILRILWNVQIYGEQNIQGSIDVRMRKDLLELFIIGANSSILSNIGKKTAVRIEVFRPETTITVTGTESSCDIAIKDMESSAAGYQETIFSLNKDERRRLSIGSPTLTAVGRSTHSLLSTPKHAKGGLLIQSLTSSNSGKARRMLLALTSGTARIERRLVDGLLPQNLKDTVISAPALDNLGISLPDRQTRLGRSVLCTSVQDVDVSGPRKQSPVLGRERTQGVVAKVLKELRRENTQNACFDTCRSVVNDHPNAYQSVGWRTVPKVVTRCNFGRLLHPEPRATRRRSTPTQDPLLLKYSLTPSRPPLLKGSFVFDYQNPAGNTLIQALFPTSRNKRKDQDLEEPSQEDSLLLEPEDNASNQESYQAFSISLVSAEGVKGIDRDSYPDLELRLFFDPASQQVQGSQLIATLRRQEVGACFPDLHADLLFTRNAQLINDDPTCQPSIRSFVEDFQARVDGLGEISPPARVVVQLPPEAMLASSPGDSDASTSEPQSLVEVEYEVSGFRYHEHFTQPHQGYQLTWDYNDAGDFGGRHEALYLQMDSDSDVTGAGSAVESAADPSQENIGEKSPDEWEQAAAFIRSTVGLLGSIQKSIG